MLQQSRQCDSNQRTRPMNQWNRIKNKLHRQTHKDAQLIFTQRSNSDSVEDIQSSTNSDRIIGHTYTYSSQDVQNLIQNDHRLKCKTVKISEENVGENLYYFDLSKQFLDMTSKVLYMKETNYKLDFNKIKNVFSEKIIVKRVKRQATD